MNSSLKIVIAMIIWGSIGIFVKNINLPSMETAFLRAAIASGIYIIYNLFARKAKLIRYSKKNLILLTASGITMGFNWLLLFQSYKFTTISNSTLSYYFAPVFVVLLSPIVLKEKLTLKKLIAIIGAMLGLFLVLSSQSTASNVSYDHIKGISYGLAAATLYASVMLFNNYIKDLSGFERTIIQLFSSALVLLPFVISRGELHIVGSKSLIFIVILGVIHTAVPYLLYFSALKDINIQNAAVLSYLDPISALIFGTLFLHEPMGMMQVLGGIFILLSTFMAQNNKSKENELRKISSN